MTINRCWFPEHGFVRHGDRDARRSRSASAGRVSSCWAASGHPYCAQVPGHVRVLAEHQVLATRVALYVSDFCVPNVVSDKVPVRIWRPALVRQFQHRMLKLRTMFYSKEKQIRLEDEWYNSITPIGAHPLEKEVSYRAWASEYGVRLTLVRSLITR